MEFFQDCSCSLIRPLCCFMTLVSDWQDSCEDVTILLSIFFNSKEEMTKEEDIKILKSRFFSPYPSHVFFLSLLRPISNLILFLFSVNIAQLLIGNFLRNLSIFFCRMLYIFSLAPTDLYSESEHYHVLCLRLIYYGLFLSTLSLTCLVKCLSLDFLYSKM